MSVLDSNNVRHTVIENDNKTYKKKLYLQVLADMNSIHTKTNKLWFKLNIWLIQQYLKQ